MGSTLYDILEVAPTASQETIHAAYRSLIVKYHPDKVVNLGVELRDIAALKTKELNAAYNTLKDPAQRRRYDNDIKTINSNTSKPSQAYSGTTKRTEPNDSTHNPDNNLFSPKLIRSFIITIVGSILFFVFLILFLFIYLVLLSTALTSMHSTITIVDILDRILSKTYNNNADGFIISCFLPFGAYLCSAFAFKISTKVIIFSSKSANLLHFFEMCCGLLVIVFFISATHVSIFSFNSLIYGALIIGTVAGYQVDSEDRQKAKR